MVKSVSRLCTRAKSLAIRFRGAAVATILAVPDATPLVARVDAVQVAAASIAAVTHGDPA